MIPGVCERLSSWTAVQDSIPGVFRKDRVDDVCFEARQYSLNNGRFSGWQVA